MSALGIATRGYIDEGGQTTVNIIDSGAKPVPNEPPTDVTIMVKGSHPAIVQDSQSGSNINVKQDSTNITVSDDSDTIIIKPGC